MDPRLTPGALGPRGAALWGLLTEGTKPDAAAQVLIAEACRVADRLETLDRLLSGETDLWVSLTHDLRTESYEVRVDGALVEARQQQQVLRQLLGQLELGKVDTGSKSEGSFLDDLAKRRAERLAEASSQ